MMQQEKGAHLSHAKSIQSAAHIGILIGNLGIRPDSVGANGLPVASVGSPFVNSPNSGTPNSTASSDDYTTWV